MRENLQNGLMVLRRKLGPMKALILMELFAALALVLYINGVFSSGPKAEVGGMLLMGFVLTFLQPKTQFGLVWTWQDKIRELSTAPLEDMGEGIEDLRVQRQDENKDDEVLPDLPESRLHLRFPKSFLHKKQLPCLLYEKQDQYHALLIRLLFPHPPAL